MPAFGGWDAELPGKVAEQNRKGTWIMAEKKLSFEQSMARLEEIVKQLEQGDAPLEDALALFEEGTKLMKKCSAQLDKAEQKVSKLLAGPDGAPVEQPFDGEG